MKCINCGKELEANEITCTVCGTTNEINPTQAETPNVSIQPLEEDAIVTPEPVVNTDLGATNINIVEQPVEQPIQPVVTPVVEQPIVQPVVSEPIEQPIEQQPVVEQEVPKKKKSNPFILVIMIVLVVAIAAVLIYFATNGDKKAPANPNTTTTSSTTTVTTTTVKITEPIQTPDEPIATSEDIEEFETYLENVVTAIQSQYVYDPNTGMMVDEKIVVYDLINDLGLPTTGNFRGYAVVDGTDAKNAKIYISLRNDKLELSYYDLTSNGMDIGTQLRSVSEETFPKSAYESCIKSVNSESTKCYTKAGTEITE